MKINVLATFSMLSLMTIFGASARAATVAVEILDEDGQPVPDVAVFILQDGIESAGLAPKSAVMDQIETQFVPHLLVIRKGTAVEFPNSDVIAHHVYSFSQPNNFVLPLYKGDAHDPVVFEHDGVVTLGCNIHDEMLGFIVVVDTDVFGTTDKTGRVELTIDEAATGYSISIWNPRIRDDRSLLTQEIRTVLNDGADIRFRLEKKLRAPHHSDTDGVRWSEY